MKTIQVPVRLPEKQDIMESWNSLSNEEICRFVCDFEGISNAQTIDVLPQFHKVREHTENNFTEYYSVNTAAVYLVSQDGMIIFEGIHFKENRPKGVGYGIDVNTRKAKAYCKKCNTSIFFGSDMIGRTHNYCNCK